MAMALLSYARADTERFIHEGSKAGTLVGAPVTAFDDATAIDVLTYSLSDTAAARQQATLGISASMRKPARSRLAPEARGRWTRRQTPLSQVHPDTAYAVHGQGH